MCRSLKGARRRGRGSAGGFAVAGVAGVAASAVAARRRRRRRSARLPHPGVATPARGGGGARAPPGRRRLAGRAGRGVATPSQRPTGGAGAGAALAPLLLLLGLLLRLGLGVVVGVVTFVVHVGQRRQLRQRRRFQLFQLRRPAAAATGTAAQRGPDGAALHPSNQFVLSLCRPLFSRFQFSLPHYLNSY